MIPAPNRRPFDDDGPLPDLISGLMWLATAAAGVAVPAPRRRPIGRGGTPWRVTTRW